MAIKNQELFDAYIQMLDELVEKHPELIHDDEEDEDGENNK